MSPIITGIGIGIGFDGEAGVGGNGGESIAESFVELFSLFDASRGITRVGSKVSEWAKQGGTGKGGKKLANAVDGDRPTFIESDANFNGEPSIDFDGTEFLRTALFDTPLEQPNMIILVVKKDVLAATFMFDGINTTGRHLFWQNNSIGAPSGVAADASITTTPLILSLRFSHTVGYFSTVWFNGVIQMSPTGNIGPHDLEGFNLGGHNGGSDEFGFDGSFAEVAVFDDLLTTEQHNLYGNELGTKYGITWTDIV